MQHRQTPNVRSLGFGGTWRGRLAVVHVVIVLVAPTATSAAICSNEQTSAATLLLPYFEVNLDDPNGLTTLFSINNASAVAVLGHVVFWSDLGVPVLDFNVYLTGYDVQSFNLRDLFVSGTISPTASASEDPRDAISPKGPFSQDIDMHCAGQLPPAPLPVSFVQHLQLALTGRASPLLGGKCAGRYLGGNVARGYVTVDTVNNCTLRFPADQGYFGPGGDVTDQNVLWGSFFIVDSTRAYAQGSDLVAIEADATSPATASGRYTFYGSSDKWTGIDHREPLATSFAAQFFNGGSFDGGTDLLVWRDSKVPQQPFDCPATPGARPPGYPLGQEGLTIFDEQEHSGTRWCNPVVNCPPPLVPFVAAAQRVAVNGVAFPVPFSFGWLYLDLNGSPAAAGSNPPVDPEAEQAWVITTLSSGGHYAVGLDAFRLDSACAARHFSPSG